MIRHRRLLLAVVLASNLSAAVGAQPGPVLLTQEEARVHVVAAPPPAYPALAQAANIEGVVDVDIEIAPDGTVTKARVLFGVPVLDGAAVDAVRRWRFTSFVSAGRPVAVRTGLTFFFVQSPPTPARVAAATELNDATLLCLHRMDLGAFAEAEPACRAAVSAAGRVRPSRTAPALTSRLLGEALAGLDRHEEAIVRFEAVHRGSVGDSDWDRALADRGMGRSLVATGNVRDALRAYDRAQDRLGRRVNAMPHDSPYRAEWADQLKPVLMEYVELLEQTGDARRAQRMRERLAALP